MEALGLDIRFLAAQLLNFGIFVWIFMKFLHKPFVSYLKDQRREEEEKARLLADLQEKDASLSVKEKALLTEAHKQAEKIIQEAHSQAESLTAHMKKEAEHEVLAMQQRATRDAQKAEAQLNNEIRQKAVTIAQAMTQTVLKEVLSEEQQKDIIASFTRTLQKSHVYEN